MNILDTRQVINAFKGLPVYNKTSGLFASLVKPEFSAFIYGWHVDPSISDPSLAVTYLEDAIGKTPASMGASTFDYGDWENPFFMPKPCMLKNDGTVDYYLDENDYSKKAGSQEETYSWEQGNYGELVDSQLIKMPSTDGYYNKSIRTPYILTIPAGQEWIISSKLGWSSTARIADSSGVIISIVSSNSTDNNPLIITASSSERKLGIHAVRVVNGSVVNSVPSDYGEDLSIIIRENSDISNSSYDGNAMMEWPLIWYKFEEGNADGEGYFYCSNQQIDSSYKCWCNLDSNGNVIPHFYTAIYNGTGTSKLRSLSGVQLTSANGNGDTTAAQDITKATANGTDWYIETLADRLLINALLVLMGKSLNTKAVYGNGVGALTAESTQALKESIITGMCNDKGLFWGSKDDYTHPVKVFGMENWWGCVFRRNAGLLCKDSKYYIKLTKGTSDGTTVNDYSFTSISGYIQSGVSSPQSSNLIKKMSFSQYGYFPAEVSSTNASWSSWLAVWNYYSEVSSALMGGVNYARTGAFEIDFAKEPASAYTISSCLSCKPVNKG